MNIKQAKERFTIEKLLSILGHEPDSRKSRAVVHSGKLAELRQ